MTWKLVPVEPTTAMVSRARGTRLLESFDQNTFKTYRAMLSDSPDPTTDDALIERVAEAIYGGDWNSLPEEAWLPNHGSIQDGKAQYRFMALAAIRAMEEKP